MDNHVETREMRTMQDELDKKYALIGDLRSEIEETCRRLDEVVMTRKSEGTALLEIEHFKADNERMIQMLALT
jgi:hypothetical protein